MNKYQLYGTEHSYFTGKIVAYLRYKGIPYEFRPASLWHYKRFIIPRTGVKYIPVLHTPDDQVLQDTSVIIDSMEQRFPSRPIYPSTPKQKLVALLFELYADEWFLLPGMHYRWSYLAQHEKYLMGEFGQLGGRWLPGPIKRALGRKICAPFKNSLKPLGITEETVPAIEAWFLQFLADFENHLSEHDYLLGSRPCLGDFALAGPLTAHTWRDPYSKKILLEHAPRTVQWIQRINAQQQPEGEFMADDEVPETLLPILRHIFKEQWPILLDTANALPAWQAKNPNRERVSRALGWHEYSIGGVREQRLIFPYAQWMMQRPLDFYQSLSCEQRRSADSLLQACDGLEAMAFQPPIRLGRLNNQVVVEKAQS